MDFDANDPLGDILSDDSNDSFFNDDKYKSSQKPKPQQSISVKKSDLFGLETDQKQNDFKSDSLKSVIKTKPVDDWLGLGESKTATPVVEKKTNVEIKSVTSSNIQKQKDDVSNVQKTSKQSTFGDELNFLDELGLSDEITSLGSVKKSEKTTKTSLSLDELLGRTSNPVAIKKDNTATSSTSYTPTASKSVPLKKEIGGGVNESITRNKPLSKELEETSKQINQPRIPIQTVKKETVGAMARRQKANTDWLGLLGDSGDDILDESTDKNETLSDLLVQTEKKGKKTDKEASSKIVQSKENVEIEAKSNKIEDKVNLNGKLDQTLNEMDIHVKIPVMPDYINNQLTGLSSNMDIEQQSAAICLQQQESHLLVALQMKAQEERLAAMHERQEESRRVQREVVSAHKEQLNSILKGQSDHRTQLQSIIMEHQQRINKHIELLLKPPYPMDESGASRDRDYSQANYNYNETYEKSAKSGKNQLEEIISILKENYEKEIELMESSYRRQITHISESLLNVEERHKLENEKLGQYYMARIEKLEQDKIGITEYFETTIKSILDKQKEERDRIEEKHLNDMDILQRQHHNVINNIKATVELEQSTLKETTDYSQKLQAIVGDVENNNKVCLSIMEKLENMSNADFLEKSDVLKKREDNLNRMLEALEKQSKAHEMEASETKSTLLVFEQRLSQQTLMIDDERNGLKQKEIALSRDKDAMKMEYQQLKEKLEYEKEMFKKTTAEFDKNNTDAKTEIEERSIRLDSESHVVKNERKILLEMKSELQMMKLKLDDQLKELNDSKRNLQSEQDRLYQNELKLLERSKDLEVLTRNALAKQKNAESKISEATYSQQRYEEKLNRIQEQFLSLNSREQQLAREKVALSRERLMIYNQRAENDYAICNICKATNIPQKLSENKETFRAYNEPIDVAMSLHSFQNENNSSRFLWLESKLDNKGLKEIKEDLNNLDKINSHPDMDFVGTIKNKEYDMKENIPVKFQEIVDPKLMAMKFDIFKTNNYS
ncbi:uncharacterized protein LOC143914590 [Arctopsyche grandis]|uniref:uncharacterized protein LOC143914590 n=1 Tax=Arctopsyche grandis TaxID=121162 RepID=UPI00406D7748